MIDYPNLFSPIKIRSLELKNRIVMPGMGTKFMTDGYVTQQVIDYHLARTRGGVGLNVVEVSSVHAPSAPPTYGSLAEDKYIPSYKKLTDAIHKEGGKASVFLWQPSIAAMGHPNVEIIVASDLDLGDGTVIPAATHEKIEELIFSYGQAARRAVEAGMDAVELHAAHNYIIHSFLSSGINHRTDEYGGSLENRARFPLAVIREIRKNIPDTMPLFMRINAHDDYLENGLTIEDIICFCKEAGKEGVDVLDISRGNIITNALKYEVPSLDIPYAFNVDNAARIKEETGMLTMAVGRINGAQLAENILKDGKADLIGMGRVNLTDPEFANKAKRGDIMDITRCIGCNQGCFDAHMKPEMEHITCVRNPAVGKEKEYELMPTTEPKDILVAGGGMAGLEAASVLSQRGHTVTLCDSSDHLGGQFVIAGKAPRKTEMGAAANHKSKQVQSSNVTVHLNTKVTPEVLAKLEPDVVINAIGGRPTPITLTTTHSHVYDALDVLTGKVKASGTVAVIGGNETGLEVAEFLAAKDHAVTVIEQKEEIGEHLGAVRKICITEHMEEKDIKIKTNTKCTKISAEGITLKTENKETTLPIDTVVIATGMQSNCFADCSTYCKEHDIPMYTIGDAASIRNVLPAIAEAAQLARKL